MTTCQRCSETATVHVTETVEGRRREIHLCGPCAREAGLIAAEDVPPLPLEGVVQGLILAHVGELVGEIAGLTCPDCGLMFMEFRRGGRLGCPRDYEAFAIGLNPILGRTQGATRHVGKRPRRPARGVDRLRLRSLLRRAIAREDYEQAAQLRDQLRLEDGDE
jgi:protein arginine kinase activator